MNTIIAILILVAVVSIIITLAPFIITLIGLLVLAAVIYGIYARHKIKKHMNQMEDEYQTYQNDYQNTNTNATYDDIIDVEFTETTESDDHV